MSHPAPGILEVLSHWRPDPFWLIVLGLAAWWYIYNFRKLEATNPRVPLPRWKMWCFLSGLVLVAIPTMSPMQHYGNILFSITLLGFVFISRIAPIFILLGSPLTLAFRVSGKPARKRLRWTYRNRISAIITYPLVAWLVFAIVTYVWGFSRLTDIAANNGVVRDIELAIMLFVGLLFYLPALCADPVRWRMNFPLRIFYVFVEVTHKALFGGLLSATTSVFHPRMAKAMPDWAWSAHFDQTIGIIYVSVIGNAVFLVVIGFLVKRWVEYEARNTERIDKQLAKERLKAAQHKDAMEQIFRRA